MLSDASAADGIFENIATKEEITQNEQFLLLSPCFQLYSIIVLSFSENFHICVYMFSKSSAVELLFVGKGGLIRFVLGRYFYLSYVNYQA